LHALYTLHHVDQLPLRKLNNFQQTFLLSILAAGCLTLTLHFAPFAIVCVGKNVLNLIVFTTSSSSFNRPRLFTTLNLNGSGLQGTTKFNCTMSTTTKI